MLTFFAFWASFCYAIDLDENRWQTVFKTDQGPQTEFTLSYQNLLPSTGYNFRIIAYNKHGISYPVASEETVRKKHLKVIKFNCLETLILYFFFLSNEQVFTPSKMYLEYGFLQASPFYRQTWFLVVIASVSVVMIIALVAYLCVKTKSHKYKRKWKNNLFSFLKIKCKQSHQTCFVLILFFIDESERSLAETASIEEGVLYGSSVELRQSHKKISTLKRKSAGGALKPPPRPTPGSVTYTDDESDKAYDHNPDESSLTEKPSEISSTDSQVRRKSDNCHLNGNGHTNSNNNKNSRIKNNIISISSLLSQSTSHSPSPTSPNPNPVIHYLPKIPTVFEVSSTQDSSSSSPPNISHKLEESCKLGQHESSSSSSSSSSSVRKCWKIIDNTCYCSAASCCSNSLLRNKIFPKFSTKNTQK